MEHLETHGVCHCDLKFENVLYDEQMNLKLIDFGHSEYKNVHSLTGKRGSPHYSAPDMLNQTYDGHKVDLFSLGVMMFILVQGLFPWESATTDCYKY